MSKKSATIVAPTGSDVPIRSDAQGCRAALSAAGAQPARVVTGSACLNHLMSSLIAAACC
jgi:hypothetical protein